MNYYIIILSSNIYIRDGRENVHLWVIPYHAPIGINTHIRFQVDYRINHIP